VVNSVENGAGKNGFARPEFVAMNARMATVRGIVAHALYDGRMKTIPSPMLATALLLAALVPATAQSPAPATVDLRILAINDFHGYLHASPGGIRISDPADRAKRIMVPAGGSEHMATLVKQLREGHKNNVFVAAGDLIGASPFLSAMFHDEPTIESLSMMGLEISAVGNHEFDEGKDELLRMQNGGCHPVDTCLEPHPFTGARFHYLAASTIVKDTGKTLFPPYEIKTYDGIPVAFIGLTLKGTSEIISPASATGLEFRDEVDTVNALVPELKAKGVEAIVLLIHEGGVPTGDYNECNGISGPIVDIVKKLDKAVDIVISGHTHHAYVCNIDGRLVTSADKYGTLVTTIDVKLDPATRDVTSARADNVIVRPSLQSDPEQTALLEAYDKVAAPIANRRAGSVTATLSHVPNFTGESVLGDVIADAQLAATSSQKGGGAVIAMTNPGGIRTDIARKGDGTVSYADLFASQPFRNQLVTVSLTGAEIRTALEQQWRLDPKLPRILQVSGGFSYSWDDSKPDGARIDASSIRLNGMPIEANKTYRVTINNYLALGGDGFAIFKQGTAAQVGDYDSEALYHYFSNHIPIAPAPPTRIMRVN
jgi:5'-nucleotidase